MHQEPCGSETTTSGYSCASDGRLVWTSDSAEQAVNTPNDDEEMLEQMSHPKNKVMERMTPLERWNGLAWVCSLAMERSCSWRGVQGPQCSPKHNAFDSLGSHCLGDPPLPFLPRQKPRTSHGKHRLRERTNRRLCRQPSKKHSKPMFRATFVTCSRTHQGMDTDGLENWVSPKKSHQRSQSTGCVLVRKARTNPHSQASAPRVQGRRRWGIITETEC